MGNEVVDQIRAEYEQALQAGGAAAEALKGATRVIASRMFQRGSVVLEFLQNAEDAKASEFSVDLSVDKVIFENNGEPFSQKNVQSLCSIGKSDKVISGGYLGYFGIGFKSAFRISEKVEVYSGNYAFKFDRDCWHDKEPDFPWQIVPHPIDGAPGGRGARFICAIDPSEKGQRSVQSLMERADHLGRAFMFLENIQKLMWKDGIGGNTRVFIKSVENESRVLGDEDTKRQELVLTLGTSQERWLLFRRRVPVPPEVQKAPETLEAGREQLTEREVVLGFQLAENGALKKASGASIYGGIFSHLPLTAEQANLPFVIQGDFVSEAGRDALDEAHPWNHWMLRCAAELLTDVTEVFKEHPQRRYEFLDLLLSQVPATACVRHHFYEPLRENLKECKIVLTDKDSWVKPTSCLIPEVQLDDFCDVVSSNGWQEIANVADLWFINPKVLNRTVVRDQLSGVRLTTSEVKAKLQDERWDEWLSGRAKANDAPVWFRRLYQALAGPLRHQEKQYGARPWVLTRDCKTVPARDAILSTKNIEGAPDSLLDFVLQLSPDAIVHPDLVRRHGDDADEAVGTFLKSLGVGDTTMDWFVEKKLLPLWDSGQWESIPEFQKSDVIRVIWKWFSTTPSRAKKMLDDWNAPSKLMLPTKEAGSWKVAGCLYLPSECNGKLESLLAPIGGSPESFPDLRFIGEEPNPDEWIAFLQTVGVVPDLRIIERRATVSCLDPKLLNESAPEVRQGLLGKEVKYQTLEFLEKLFDSWAPVDGDGLFLYLASLWSKDADVQGLFKDAQIVPMDAEESCTSFSSWSPLLGRAWQSNWIPTNGGLRSPLALEKRPAFTAIEADKPLILGLAPLLDGKATDAEKDFLEFWGIKDARQGLDEDDLLRLVSLLSDTGWPREKTEPRLEHIYTRLASLDDGVSRHSEIPVLTHWGTWLPVGQTYVGDSSEAALFEDCVPFAWTPKDEAERYHSLLRQLGARSVKEELRCIVTARRCLGTYPYIKGLLELAGINGVDVWRYDYVALTFNLAGYSKDIPKRHWVKSDETDGRVHIFLGRDFAVGDSEISELQASLTEVLPGKALSMVDPTDVIEWVGEEEAKHREGSKGQTLTRAGKGSGFDFHSSGPKGDYKVEVKGRSEKGDVTLIGDEPGSAKSWGKDYLLYVVYNCRLPEPFVKQCVNPASFWEERTSTSYVIPERAWSVW